MAILLACSSASARKRCTAIAVPAELPPARQPTTLTSSAPTRNGSLVQSLLSRPRAKEGTMLPIGDDRSQGGPPPVVTIALIALNVLLFLFEISKPSEGALQAFIQGWGVV